MSDYRIRVTRMTPESWDYKGGEKQTHYYNEMDEGGTQYNYADIASIANTFTEQQIKIIIKNIELKVYGEHSKTNGTLLKIEILESETLKLVSMCKFETITSRFELMDL